MNRVEDEVLNTVKREMDTMDNKDSINKLYRQARIWVRFHCYYANECTPERARELNIILKKYRVKRLRELGYSMYVPQKTQEEFDRYETLFE